MNKKSLALILSAFAVSALSLSAQTAASAPAPSAPIAPSVSVTIAPSFVSQYMFRGQRLGGASFQPVVEASYGAATLGLWSNFPMKDKVAGQSDPEFDFYGAYSFPINETISVVPGFTFYDYPSAPTKAGFYRSTFEPSIAVNYTFSGVKLTPKLYYDVTLHGPTYELTGAYAYPLKDLGTELNFTATIGTYKLTDATNNVSPSVKTWGDYWLVGIAAPFQINTASKVTIGFAYTKGSDAFYKQGSFPKSSNTAAVGRGVVTLSYSYTF